MAKGLGRSRGEASSLARGQAGLLVGLMLTTWACGPPAAATRGFGSRQLLVARDPALELRSFRGDGTGIYLARSLATSTPTTPIYDRSLLDLATDQETPIAEAVTNAYILPAGTGPGSTLVLLHYGTLAEIPANPTGATGAGGQILSFIDEATGGRLDLPGVTNVTLGSTRADPIMLGRYDAAGRFASWFGPPESLLPLPRNVTSFAGFDGGGAVVTIAGTDGTTLSIVRLPLDGTDATEIVPSTLSDHVLVTTGGPGNPLLGPAPLVQVVGYSCPRASDGVPPPRCILLYTRAAPDATQQHLFVRLLDDPREVELPGDNPVFPTLSPDGQAIVWWATLPSGTMNLFSWTVGADHAGSCESTTEVTDHSQILWRAHDNGFAVVAGRADPSGTTTWVLLTGTPGDPCRVIASGTKGLASMAFSPNGSLLGRLELTANSDAIVHVGALDGTGDRIVAAGSDLQGITFLDDRRLEFRRVSGDGVGLSWLDLGADPVVEHPIAERVRFSTFSSWVWINPRWLLLADSYSAADDTFTLAVADTDTGDEQIVSTAVTEFRVPWTTVPPGATELPVVFTVRGRSASAQDGVWLAHLPLAAFPP